MFGPCRDLIDDYIFIFVHTLKSYLGVNFIRFTLTRICINIKFYKLITKNAV